MDIYLLFRKKSPLSEEGLPWLCGALEHLRVYIDSTLLAVDLLYVWLISTGARTIQDGLRHLVDRNDRRDLSLFQIGWRIIERWLVNAVPIRVSWCVYR
jgi:hypothetical protein